METQQTTPAGETAAVVQLEGSLDRVRVNRRDGWIVGVLYDSKKGERHTITGTLPDGLRPGDHLRLTGTWTTHDKFGKQFNFTTAAPVTPTGADGVKKWLVRYIDGIGDKAAEFLIDHLGVDGATKVLEERTTSENDPLVEIAGFTPERAAKARQSFAALGAYPEQKLWLAKHDIVGALAGRVVKKYKEETRTVLEADPYKPMLDVDGFGFLRCDEFAKKLGVLDHDPRRARAAIVQSFADQAMEGHVFLLEEQLLAALAKDYMVPIAATRDALAEVLREGLVVTEGKSEPRLYLSGLRECEREIAFDVLRLIDAGAKLEPIEAPIDPQLNEEQQGALNLCGRVAFIGLTGGPGTGKSHTLRAILRLLDPENEKTLLAAPTGKAAKRMSQATGRPASTIHRALEFGPGANGSYGFKRTRNCKLWQRVIVIDEASMVDTELAAALFSAIPDGARVIIVGDVDQLPSVGPGTVLKDLLDCELLPVVRLVRNMRSAEGGAIATAASKVIRGIQLDGEADLAGDVSFLEVGEAETAAAEIVRLVAGGITGYDLADIQVLCPKRIHALGVESLNKAIQRKVNPAGAFLEVGDTVFRVGDKVLVTRNDYELLVFNGDTGIVQKVDPEKRRLRIAIDGGESLVFEKDSLRIVALAYAITVHKSQGSEYRCVVMPVHSSDSFMLTRQLTYTALTRAREKVFIVGDRKGLSRAIRKSDDSKRNTSLFARIRYLNSKPTETA